MISYLDTSAALKLLIQEDESAAFAEVLDGGTLGQIVSSMLLFTELHCAAQRRRQIDAESVNALLDGIMLVDLSRADLIRAGSSRWGLRSADAIHLAVSLSINADQILTYDQELAEVATPAGLRVLAPT